MSTDILLERGMLYPTDEGFIPGSIHIQVFSPEENARLPVVIESKSGHSPLKHMDTIVRIMQSEIFDKIFINIKKNVDIYVKVTDELSGEYGNHSHIKVSFTDDGISCEGVDR